MSFWNKEGRASPLFPKNKLGAEERVAIGWRWGRNDSDVNLLIHEKTLITTAKKMRRTLKGATLARKWSLYSMEGVYLTAWLFTLPLENGGIVWGTRDGSGLEIRPLWLPTLLPLPWHRISIGAKRYPKRQKSENCWRRWIPTPLWLWFLHYPIVGMKIVVLSPTYSNQQDNFKIISIHRANLNQMNQSLPVGLEYWYFLVLPRWF